jgi:PilZ domain
MATTNIEKRITGNRSSLLDGEANQSGKRRSLRVVIDIPVTVFGQNLDHKIFAEHANTVTVSAHGASVILNTDIDPQRPALLQNTKTGAEAQCRVAHRKELGKGRLEIGFEFERPLPRFWAINFPPEDWNPADRKKPMSTHQPTSTPTKGMKK